MLTAIPDIFDRLIVADTQRLNAPLLTHDTTIQAGGAGGDGVELACPTCAFNRWGGD